MKLSGDKSAGEGYGCGGMISAISGETAVRFVFSSNSLVGLDHEVGSIDACLVDGRMSTRGWSCKKDGTARIMVSLGFFGFGPCAGLLFCYYILLYVGFVWMLTHL